MTTAATASLQTEHTQFESVPNLSTARDQGLLDELGARMIDAGVDVVDRSADADHRRSVWTWLGTARQIERAAAACLSLLGKRRSIRSHRGAHPRTGLLDVLPWIPLAPFLDRDLTRSSAPGIYASTLRAARQAARATGARLAESADLPAFFYEHAATAPDRRDLARHRRALRGPEGISIPAGWPQDAGPDRPHPRLGVLMVGARHPLIAFNVDLESEDVGAARDIAAAIRQSTPGGLPGVKALGLLLRHRGCAQVSVNLVDAHRTDLPHLVSRIRYEAKARGIGVRRSERIGLLTEVAVAGAEAKDLGLDELLPEHLVETHLRKRLGP